MEVPVDRSPPLVLKVAAPSDPRDPWVFPQIVEYSLKPGYALYCDGVDDLWIYEFAG